MYVDEINAWIGRITCSIILIVCAFILYEVLKRYLLNAPTIWVHESTQLLFGACAILAGGFILKQDAHIRVDIIYEKLSQRSRAMMDIVTFPVFFIYTATLLYFSAELAWDSVAKLEYSGSFWNPPIYPFKAMMPIGAFLLLLQGLHKLMKDILTFTQTGGAVKKDEEA